MANLAFHAITLLGFFLLVYVGFSCMNEDEKLLNTVSGTWTITKVIFKTVTNPDSVVSCSNCILQLDDCKLGSGGCNGFYQLMDGQKVNIVYAPRANAQELAITVIGEPSSPRFQLIGPHKLYNVSTGSMNLTGEVLARLGKTAFQKNGIDLSVKR